MAMQYRACYICGRSNKGHGKPPLCDDCRITHVGWPKPTPAAPVRNLPYGPIQIQPTYGGPIQIRCSAVGDHAFECDRGNPCTLHQCDAAICRCAP